MVLADFSELGGCEDPQTLQHGRGFLTVQDATEGVIAASSCELLRKGASPTRTGPPHVRHRADRKEGVALRENNSPKVFLLLLTYHCFYYIWK